MKIFVVTGQTATGKTAYAAKLAKHYNGELLNADSRQVYKELNIITGKDFPSGVKIHLYDIVDPVEYFSSFDYAQKALPLIEQLLKRGKTPIIVGGSYLYLKHLLYDIETENIPPDWKLRKDLENKAVPELQRILNDIAPRFINELNNSERNNPQRLIRKIEILKSDIMSSRRSPVFHDLRSSMTLSEKLNIKNLQIEFIGLRFNDKESLKAKIIARVEDRLKKGAIDEVKKLLVAGYTENDPGLKTIGYQQLIKYLKGEWTKEQAIEQWIYKELQYSKRQYTFMKKDPNLVWKTI